MPSVTDLPIRQSTSPAAYEPPAPQPPQPPSMVQWIKAGFGFAFGAWIAAVLLFIPSFILYMRFVVLLLESMGRVFARH